VESGKEAVSPASSQVKNKLSITNYIGQNHKEQIKFLTWK
jgi:hypothetical protein